MMNDGGPRFFVTDFWALSPAREKVLQNLTRANTPNKGIRRTRYREKGITTTRSCETHACKLTRAVHCTV